MGLPAGRNLSSHFPDVARISLVGKKGLIDPTMFRSDVQLVLRESNKTTISEDLSIQAGHSSPDESPPVALELVPVPSALGA